ncbi:MAG TPA: Hsp20/alpha crystallin family protein [Myxococcota bacterium]|nr:Hsp20/alpha crystallin family protein [Myxococcota bacterium]
MRWELASTWPWPSVDEIERRFEELIRERWGAGVTAPPADVFVAEESIWVELDLPGVELRDVRVRSEAGWLWIEAMRRPRPPSEAARPARVERARGALRRAVPLPAGLHPEPVEVTLEAGVLRIHLRKELRS